MKYEKFIVTNFAYGTGPYLRTTELAIAFNNELEKAGEPRMRIIVPLVYGERQSRIMDEEFSDYYARYPEEVILDEKLGAILKKAFYEGGLYKEYVERWAKTARTVSIEAHDYLLQEYGNNIALELNRSPRIRYDVAPSYFTSFGYIGEILEKKEFPREYIETANEIEKNHKMHCIAYPATFSYGKDYKPRYSTEVLVPPIGKIFSLDKSEIVPGIFITVTGIPKLERLYNDAKNMGMKLYSNNTDAVPGSVKASPHIITNKNISFQFARSGWSSVWLSMLSGTPLVVSEYDPNDDPEIYFNNIAIEEMGIGVIYRGQPLDEILSKFSETKKVSHAVKEDIMKRWDTLDGNVYCATLFAQDFLR